MADGFHPAALASALGLVRRATSPATAKVVEDLIRARDKTARDTVDLRVLADFPGLGDVDTQHARIDAANSEFRSAFGMVLVRHIPLPFDEAASAPICDEIRHGRLSAAFVDLLDRPMTLVIADEAVEPDSSTASWIGIAAACPRSGRGHHLVLRCVDHGPREPTDIARLIVTRCTDVRFSEGGADSVEVAVLRAELHGGAVPALVVMDRELVTTDRQDENDSWDRPVVTPSPEKRLSSSEADRLRLLRGLRNTYVWRAPADFVVETELAAFYGGAIGPIAPTRRWRDGIVAGIAPEIGDVGTRALVSRVADPRDAGALAAIASVAANALGIDLDEAAVFVAGSLSDARSSVPTTPSYFDARLVICDDEGQLLLARAGELARNGARVLFHGPPGGGKSSFAQALAAAMGRGAETITGASILARHWGVTERIISDVWSRAADTGTTLIIDEIDSLCGVREPGASSGNAYLIRTLTNEFLRALDTHASVAVIATANHLEAIDDAVRRRFTFVINVRGELTPEAEELAWHSIFRVEPPVGWAAVGANVSDFANATRRCRMLGLVDASSLATAVERSRDARLGPRGHQSRNKQSLQ